MVYLTPALNVMLKWKITLCSWPFFPEMHALHSVGRYHWVWNKGMCQDLPLSLWPAGSSQIHWKHGTWYLQVSWCIHAHMTADSYWIINTFEEFSYCLLRIYAHTLKYMYIYTSIISLSLRLKILQFLTCGEQNEKEIVFNELIFQKFYRQAQFQVLNHESESRLSQHLGKNLVCFSTWT